MKKINISDTQKSKIKDLLKFLILVFVIAVFACQPYLNNMMIYTHDFGYHLNRIIQISENLKIGVFPSFIHSGLLNNLGYANSIFYPEIFLYIPAIIMAISGVHVLTAYKFFLIVINFFTFLSMFISAKGIFKKKSVAWISSLLYTFSLYRLTDIYVRGALGEILAFIFIPIIFYGLYEIIFDENQKWWIISLGLFGLANSHVLTFIICIPIIVLLCLLNIDKIFKDKKKIINLILAAVTAILLCIGFFGPMIEQKLNDTFYIDGQSIESSEALEERAMSMSMALGSNLKAGYAVDSSTRNDGLSEGVGAILLIMAMLIFLRKGMKYSENRFEIQLWVIGMFICFMATKLFPWESISLFNVIQFPFRLIFIPTVCFSLVGANSFYEIVTNKKDSAIILSIVILVISGYTLSNVQLNFNPSIYQEFDDLIEGIDHETGSSEYLPTNSDVNDLNLYNIYDEEKIYNFDQIGSKITFDYNEENLDFEINIPLIYYKGYIASLEDNNGNITKLEVVKNEKNGHVLVKGEKGLTGKITVEYKATKVQIISYLISDVTLICLFGYIIYKKVKSKKK